MKKFFISLVFALICSVFVCACNVTKVPENTEPSVITEIRTAYYNKYKEHFVSEYYTYTADDITIDYYGEFNGAHVVYISAPCFSYTTAIEERTIDGVTIVYPTSQTLEVYKDGGFYFLETAFENGFIDHGNLVDIRNRFKSDSFFPYPNKDTVDRIKTKYYELHKNDGDFKLEDVGINFYGEYRLVYVMFIGYDGEAVGDAITEENIDGITIVYPNTKTMTVFYGGEFYSLNQAFENGYLTRDNVKDIRDKYKSTH